MHKRIGARENRLARNYCRRRRQHDHRQQEGFRYQTVERILNRSRIGQHLGALSEIIDQQRRQYEAEPGGLDRFAAEMTEIGIERPHRRDDKKYGTKSDQPDLAVTHQKFNSVERIDCEQHCGSSRMCNAPAIAIAANQTTITGPNIAAPWPCRGLRGEQPDQDDTVSGATNRQKLDLPA